MYHSIGVFDDSIVLDILMKTATLENTYTTLLKTDKCISSFLLDGMYARQHSPFLCFQTGKGNPLREMPTEIYREQLRNDAYSEEIISSLMIAFLYRPVRDFGNSPGVKRQTVGGDAARIYRYFIGNFASASLGELAQELGFSEPYCSAFIKRLTGQTFSALLKQFRFRRAEELLKTTAFSVSHISELLGYNDPENFIRAFQKAYGCSPTQYRKI